MRWAFRSSWAWLVACVVIGAAAVAVCDWLVLREGMALADAFAGGLGEKPGAPRRYTVAILFGLVTVPDTEYPYLWFLTGSVLTGGSLGLAAWGLGRIGLGAWRWVRQRNARPADPAE